MNEQESAPGSPKPHPTLELKVTIKPDGFTQDGKAYFNGGFVLNVQDKDRIVVHAKHHFDGDPAELAGETVKAVLRKMNEMLQPPRS